MGSDVDVIPIDEYTEVINSLLMKGGEKVNLLGGEPTLHPLLKNIININKGRGLKTTLYTNGGHMAHWEDSYIRECFEDVTVRLSIYSRSGPVKSLKSVKEFGEKGVPLNLEICFMVSADTTVEELLLTAIEVERDFKCKVFFISSLRELDNPRQEFFDDTKMTMPVMEYKELVHTFLNDYEGDMEIHVSKRGVFESTTSVAEHKCRFANYVIGGKIVQCPYDLVNLKFQEDYEFNKRDCQHNNSCLMSKVIYQRK
jgi:MoaA/NifB/PqqE/SkfB family radical SAM enzyme